MHHRPDRTAASVIYGVSRLTDYDVYLFREGKHFRLYEKLGAHPMEVDGTAGTLFAVWAPNAERVSVIGDFNGWDPETHPLVPRWDGSGIWEGFIPGVGHGSLYKYHIVSRYGGYSVDKGDPLAFFWETPPGTASIVWDLRYDWRDEAWLRTRHRANARESPMAIYEVHLGSWRRVPEEGHRPLTYREMAEALTQYVKEMGFTHVEFLPVMEHPFYGSWGYQTVGYFAPTSRYGTPQDFMFLVDTLHQQGVGVLLDWVPSHFPSDAHGLAFFDGTHLYEHADPRKGFHPHWNSYIFNYGRLEVRSFLISSALFWLDVYHADGLRVDAVASMLYLDYGRPEGAWVPNEYGGKENLEAIAFLRCLNEEVYRSFPDVQTIAEESTAWPMVSRPTYVGGLGFGLKWNMGWMHDTLTYFSKDPIFRKYHHDQLTFSIWYAFSENFVLPLSHDEVVHGKGSLLAKLPGDDWQKFANLRALLGYMYGHPGKKLLFMGNEFGPWREWNHDESLDWHLLADARHRGLQQWVRDLNALYRREPALHEGDCDPAGFEWVDFHDWEQSVISFLRKALSSDDVVLVVCNFTPVPRFDYRVGVPRPGYWRELLNSDASVYGGAGYGNLGGVEAVPIPFHGRPYSVSLTLPPLGVLFLKGPAG
jgi:1,4-alpha-glucan branching enzyme